MHDERSYILISSLTAVRCALAALNHLHVDGELVRSEHTKPIFRGLSDIAEILTRASEDEAEDPE